MTGEDQFDENAVCEVCGKFGAFEFGDRHLCADCYEASGSCCPEFGGEDQEESAREQARHETAADKAK